MACRQMNYQTTKNKRWVVKREQTLGIIGSESCLSDMKRKLIIILVCATIMQYHYLQKDNFGIGF